MAAKVPCCRGSGNTATRPDGDRTQTLSTVFHDATTSGCNPSASSRRSAPAVSPSPQHLSRGNRALSTSTTSRPDRASVMADAQPDGPPPTTATSAISAGTAGRLRLRPRRLQRVAHVGVLERVAVRLQLGGQDLRARQHHLLGTLLAESHGHGESRRRNEGGPVQHLGKGRANSPYVTGVGAVALRGPRTSGVSRAGKRAPPSPSRATQLTHGRPPPMGPPRPSLKGRSNGLSNPPGPSTSPVRMRTTRT